MERDGERVKRLDVRPATAGLDPRDGLSGYAVDRSQFSMQCVALANASHVVFGQASEVMLGASPDMMRAAESAPAFRVHVSDVVELGSNEQMSRLDTGRPVAAVQDIQVCGDQPYVRCVGLAVSVKSLAGLLDDAVATRQPSTSPDTAIAVVNRIPEHEIAQSLINHQEDFTGW